MLATVAVFFREIFKICSNGSIPNLKFVSALVNEHKRGNIYHSSEDVLSWAPTAGSKIRMCAKHFRDLAMDGDKLLCCMRKAWGLKARIDWATSEHLWTLGSLGVRNLGSLGFGT